MHGIEEVQLTSKKLVDGDLKVFFSLVSLILIASSPKLTVHLTGLAIFSLLSFHAARMNYFRIIRPSLFFILPGMFAVCLTAGISAAMATGLRCLASVSVLTYLISTTTIPEFFASLKRLRLPYFVAETATLIYRVIQILMDEASRMEVAASSKHGFASRKAFLRTVSLLSYSLFIRAMKRAEIVEFAMESRCYSGKMPVHCQKSRGWIIAIACLSILAIAWWFL
ncbi:ABC transporter permease [Archaeoglobus veneficus]|uniref:ABC-type transporter, integral membrane subunit n=1 Tax=Archaeoglobus veneficus (strain DSM 11195 / SNP6) TaxID=693661 RepID=F2KS05_ARCVS|nr:ABC transporter permease [Archaeoglobus veneficus]AEA46846.1 ABC-type transporter, integral membrane subunit [Archaeoglobus veneficus SNP6]